MTPKVIIVMSPQPWGKMQISKHHYAIALAKAGHRVFFFNSPNEKGIKKFTIKDHPELPSLKLVYYHLMPFVWNFLRFKARWIFERYYKFVMQRSLRKHKIVPDELWCFDPNTTGDLKVFKAKKIIFFAADQVTRPFHLKVASQADLVISVSDIILDSFASLQNKKLLINHGLSDHFAVLARKKLQQNDFKQAHAVARVGYVGNLLIRFIHKPTLKKIFDAHPGIHFFLWGSYQFKTNNFMQDATDESLRFIDEIIHLPNVTLMDAKEPGELAVELDGMDAFLMCYDIAPDPNKGSNSHKILEYLSTGKVIVSNHVSSYAQSGLFEMLEDEDISRLPQLFQCVIDNAANCNSVEQQKARIQFTLANTYEQHVHTIHSHLYN